MKNVLLDTGFILAYCDKQDCYHKNAKSCDKFIRMSNLYRLVILCSVLNEVLSTRFIRKGLAVETFEKEILYRGNLEILNYQNCVDLVKDTIIRKNRAISLTDMHLRNIIQNGKIDIFITSNAKDFYDVIKSTKIIDIRTNSCS